MRRIALATIAALLAAAPAGATLTQGAKAPDFSTRGALAGKVFKVNLRQQLRHGPVVLYFFPAAFTGGCNAEAHAFAEAINDFKAAGAQVIGMSADTVPVLQQFSTEKCAGKFPVASAGPAIVSAYDVAFNIPAMGDRPARAVTSRTSYVIAQDGRIVLVHSDMKPDGHIAATLEAVRALQHPKKG